MALIVSSLPASAAPTPAASGTSTPTPAPAPTATPSTGAGTSSAPAKPAPKPPAKPVAKPAPKKPGKAPPPKPTRITRTPDVAARRQVAGGPLAEDASAGAESAELAALREAERELFPASQPPVEAFPSTRLGGLSRPAAPGEGALSGEGRPRVIATGLPAPPVKGALPVAEGGKDLSWMTGLVMPEFPVRWEPRLIRYLEFFKDDPRGRATIGLWLRRSGRYEAQVRKLLRQKKVPEDLIWLSMIESGFDPTIRSPAGAVGLWQFMAETARQYGMVGDRWLDPRMDVVKATESAAEFLADLYKRFGSWELAMAGYNMGYAGLLVVVRKYNTNDYWALSQLEGALPWETTLYVPKILAASIVARNPQKFGFGDLALEPALEAEEVWVAPTTPLATVAKAASVTTKEIETLNPELRAGRAPPLADDDPKSKTFPVKVPIGKAQAVAQNLPKVKRDEKPLERYVVKFGESLEQVAQARGTSTAKLSELNAIAPGEIVRGGTVLLVPRAEDEATKVASKDKVPPRPAAPAATTTSEPTSDPTAKPVVVVPPDLFVYPDKKRVFYRVTAGDSLRDVSSAFGVSVDEIRRWNALDAQGRLHEGMTLQLFVAPDADLSRVVSLSESEVRPLVVGSEEFFAHFEGLKGRKRIVLAAKAGDTLESIGRKYSLSVASMERINRRGRGETLRDGDRVIVYAADNAVATSNASAAKAAPADVAEPNVFPGISGPEPLGPPTAPPAPERLPPIP